MLAIARRQSSFGLLLLILIAAFSLRVVSPSPGTLASGDHAFLAAWSRQVAEATSVRISWQTLSAAWRGDDAEVRSELQRDRRNLVAAFAYGLSGTPIRVQNLLDVFLLGIWFRLVGFHPATAELFMILVSMAELAAVYATALVIWRDRRIALMSAVLMAILPGSLQTARWLSWHLFGQLLVTLAVLTGLLGISASARLGRPWPALAAGAVWGLSLYSNMVLPFMVPVILLPAFLDAPLRRADMAIDTGGGTQPGLRYASPLGAVQLLTVYAAGAALVFVPAVAVIGLRWPAFVHSIGVLGVGYYRCCMVAARLGAMPSAWSAAVTVPVLLLSAYGALVSLHDQARPRIIAVWLVTFAAFSAVFGTPELNERTLLFVLPAIALLAASGSVRLYDRLWRIPGRPFTRAIYAGGVFAVVATLTVPTIAYLRSPTVRTVKWRAIEWVVQRAKPDAVIITNLPHGVQVLAPNRQTYTVVSAESLVDRHQRYPQLAGQVSQLFVLLDVGEVPKPPEPEILDLVSRSMLGGVRPTDRTQSAEFGPDIRIYVYERPH